MENQPLTSGAKDPGPFYHGTKADLKPGDVLKPGYNSNYGERRRANYIYLTATLDAATWGAELGMGDGVEPELHLQRDHVLVRVRQIEEEPGQSPPGFFETVRPVGGDRRGLGELLAVAA